jgi:hypothetical protein
VAATNGTRKTIAVVTEDLFILSKIAPAVTHSGLEMAVMKPGNPVPASAVGMLLDLTCPGDWESTVEAARARDLEVIGFGPHVDGELMKRARRAGCTRVMARSKFATDIHAIVAGWSAPPDLTTA